MTLEVGERDNDVGIHEGVANLGLLHVLAVFDRDQGLVRALEAVGDDDVAAGGIRGEAVLVRAIDMLKRVFAAAYVKRVAVREEGLAAQLLDHVYHGARVIGAQEGQVAQLAKVDLDGNELVLEVDLLYAGALDEALELVQLALATVRAQVGEVNLSRSVDVGCGVSCGGIGHEALPFTQAFNGVSRLYDLKSALAQMLRWGFGSPARCWWRGRAFKEPFVGAQMQSRSIGMVNEGHEAGTPRLIHWPRHAERLSASPQQDLRDFILWTLVS